MMFEEHLRRVIEASEEDIQAGQRMITELGSVTAEQAGENLERLGEALRAAE